MLLQDEYWELVLLSLHLKFYFLDLLLQSFQSMGLLHQLLFCSDGNDRNSSLFLHGIARSITSPNAIESSTVIALAPGPRDSTNS